MAINPLYIPLFTIEEVILDKDTGLPLSGGEVRFYRDSQRLQPKEVYQISGSSPNYTFTSIGAVLTLGIDGTFVDLNGNPIVPYAYPYDAAGEVDLYYVTVESQGAVQQFVRQAVPYIPSGSIPPEELANTENELANSQFVEVNFPSTGSTVISVTGANTVTPIAPDWDIITSGTGTLTVARLQPTTAGLPTNPPYTLSITASSGLGATISLRQRLHNSPSIIRGQYASGTFIAALLSGSAAFVSMDYVPSTGTPTIIIGSQAIPNDGAYHIITANTAIPDQANSAASVGYVDIVITIPTIVTVAISSIQLVGVAFSVDIPYDEQTSARQKDHLFHYYLDATVKQPKSNLLTGWTFGLNPWQFRTTASTNVANNTYTADQTIIVQQAFVDTATANNVAVGRGTNAQNYAFQITAVSATNKTAMIQYVDPETIRPYWGEKLSLRLRASVTTTHSTVPRFKVRLMYKAGLPGTISQTVPMSAWSNTDDSIPTISGDGWTYITAVNDPTYTLTGTMQEFDFNGFQLPASSNVNMTLAVVFIMMNNLDQTATADVINVERASLVRNDFAIDADPETYDENLRRCQFYYEKSYNDAVLPGTSDSNGIINISVPVITDGSSTGCDPKRICLQFKQTKRTASPSITFYTPTGTVNNISVGVVNNQNSVISAAANKAISQWSLGEVSQQNALYSTNNTTTAIYLVGSSHLGYEGFMQFQYTIDARLGI